MDQKNDDLHQLEVLGYEVLPRPHAHSPGYSGVRLVLPQHAVGHELGSLVLTVIDWQGQPHITKFHAETSANEYLTVGIGRINVRSQSESEGVFYTFGGELSVERLAQETILMISSAAPILELIPKQNTPANLLAAEAEAMMGRVEAAKGWSHFELMEHLMAAGPLTTYLAVIQSVITWYDEASSLRHLHPELVSLLQSEKEWHRRSGQWSIIQPDLQTLVKTA